jgi:hypothetical protein
MAACLVLAIYLAPVQRPAPRPVAVLPEGYTYGLDVGSLGEDPAGEEAAQQQRLRQMPGGALYSKIAYP